MNDLPDTCRAERIVADWLTAVQAFRNHDHHGVVDALTPEGMGDVETYTRLVGLVTVAAEACGFVQRKLMPHDPDDFYGMAVTDERTGAAVDPDSCVEDANTVAAARLMVAAANQDQAQVRALVMAHMPFDGAMERSGVLLDLLGLYCALTEGAG